jgi:phospholipase/carboxylesterase
MREQKFAEITVRLTGGEDREGGGDGPLVVLMHGFGAPGTDLVGLWRVLDVPRGVRFAFPEAPNEIPGMPGAKAWWNLDLGPSGNLSGNLSQGASPPGIFPRRESFPGCIENGQRESFPGCIAAGNLSPPGIFPRRESFGNLSPGGNLSQGA